VTPEVEPMIVGFGEWREPIDWLTPSVGLWVAWVPRSSISAIDEAREVRVDYLGGRLAACGNVAIGSRAEVATCLGMDAGRLAARGGDGVIDQRSQARPWMALSVLGRARWTMAPPVFVEALGGLGITLTPRWELTLTAPDTTLYVVPVLYGHGGGSLGVFL
jgi:hypothetical protein